MTCFSIVIFINFVENVSLISLLVEMALRHVFCATWFKYFFKVWWSLGRILGLCPFHYDEEHQKFVCTRSAKIYSLFVGITVIITYPIAGKRYLNAILEFQSGSNKTIDIILDLALVAWWSYLMLLYYLYVFKIQKLVDILNDVNEFSGNLEEIFSNFNTNVTKFQFCFGLSAMQRFWRTCQLIVAISIVADVKALTVFDIFLMIYPQLTTAFAFTHFYFGILLVWFSSTLITTRINQIFLNMNEKQENLRKLECDLKTCDELDQLSQVYASLFRIHQKSRSFFCVITLYFILDYFQSLVLAIFFQFIRVVDLTFGYDRTSIYDVILINTFVIIMTTFDLYLFCEIATKCARKVFF